MTGMNCSYYSRVCETARRMTKFLLICRVQRGTACRIIPRRIQRRINNFFMIPEAEATLPLAEQMEGIYSDKEEKGPYINNVEKMDPVGTAEYVEKADEEQVNTNGVRSTCTRSRSRIQSTQSGFKVIEFTNSVRRQAGEPVGDEEFMAYLADTLVVLNDNGFPFKNNIEYAWAKFMQDSKMTKRSIGRFFNNPDLALMREHLNYKNMNEMRPLLTELPYSKVTW